MFDLSLGKMLVIGVLALFLVGPDKLPQYATALARWVRVARSMFDEAKGRLRTELGPEFDDVDWASLDPRRYHPRRLLAEAWNSTASAPAAGDRTDRDEEPDLLALADARAVAWPPTESAVGARDLGA
ncbi:hypothetical protein [Amnibacterium kyonggiense]